MQLDDVVALLDRGHGYCQVTLKVSSCAEHVRATGEIEHLLRAFPDAAGWIARQSGVTFPPERDDPGLGAVLEAELGNATESLQIRRHDAAWVWTRLTEGEGDPCLAEDVLLATLGGRAALYRRYWSVSHDGLAEIRACRLVAVKEIP